MDPSSGERDDIVGSIGSGLLGSHARALRSSESQTAFSVSLALPFFSLALHFFSSGCPPCRMPLAALLLIFHARRSLVVVSERPCPWYTYHFLATL